MVLCDFSLNSRMLINNKKTLIKGWIQKAIKWLQLLY